MNKNSSVLLAIQQFYPGYHPLISIAQLAHSSAADPRLQFDCHKAIAKYVEPELKSLEVRGTIEDVRRVSVSLFDEQDVLDVEVLPQLKLQQVDTAVDDY